MNKFIEEMVESITQDFELYAEFCAVTTTKDNVVISSDDGEGNSIEVTIKQMANDI